MPDNRNPELDLASLLTSDLKTDTSVTSSSCPGVEPVTQASIKSKFRIFYLFFITSLICHPNIHLNKYADDDDERIQRNKTLRLKQKIMTRLVSGTFPAV